MIAVTVQPGDTLSGIAAEHGDSLASVEAVNPQLSGNFNYLLVGWQVNLPDGSSAVITAPNAQPPAQTPAVPNAASPSALPTAPIASAPATSC